ncbi:MAG TPA: hypothetical protein VGZ25_11715 [Gemmataceae bacterium]|nr:hypothetical protein [Gemmataceae bacterium]
MPPVAELDVQVNLLSNRLSSLRKRIRFVIFGLGISSLLAIVLAVLISEGLLDWHYHLPGLIRAFALVGGLGTAGIVGYRYLLRPLAHKVDDLSLALRIERAYPELNDGLASTVQFLGHQHVQTSDSTSLRRAAIRKAIKQTKKRDFSQVIDKRGVLPALLAMLLLSGVGLALAWQYPEPTRTALARLADPFGNEEWPKQTRIELEHVRSRIGRNELFEIRGWIHGVIPEKAVVAFRFDGAREVDQLYELNADEEGGARLLAKLEAARVQRNFSFQVRANDAFTPWQEVSVLPPPTLVSLDGLPSPQVQLLFPAYSDLAPLQLTPGSGNVEAIDGTRVALRAAADRPLTKAWIELVPQTNAGDVATFLAPLATHGSFETVTLSARAQSWGAPVPAVIDVDQKTFAVNFAPRISGLYVLHFEDESQLRNSRVFELHILEDPAPTVTWQRPNDRQDSLSLLPGASFSLQAAIEDPVFAIRNCWLEYRLNDKELFRSVPLYDHSLAGMISNGLAPGAHWLPLIYLPPPHLRPKALDINQRISLALFKHVDAAHPDLKEGDVLTLQITADDFDDITFDKAPGISHQVQIRIVSRNALDVQLNQDQAKIEQELVRLREEQREAIKKSTEAEKSFRRNAKLTRDQIADLVQAEMLQQQIRERVGAESKDGVRAEVDRVRQALRDNRLPRSETDRRLDDIAEQLARLARDELPAIEPRLTEARKVGETGRSASPDRKEEDNPLAEARKHQDEVEKTLSDLLARMEAWSSTREIKGETKSILEDQKRLRQDTERLNKDLQGRTLPQNAPSNTALSKEQLDQIKETEANQQALEERTTKLLEKMERVANDRKDKDPRTAEQLRQAHDQATSDSITNAMQEASKEIGQNQLNKAVEKQTESIGKLEKLVQSLDKQREVDLDQLVKKLRQAEKKLADLTDEQEKLQKKMKEASALTDPREREEQLKRLAREQERLQKETQDLLKELSRLQAGAASKALAEAGNQMNQAGQKLSRGQAGDNEQDEALDRLNDAQQELEKVRADAEEQLAREQVAKATELIQHLKERQEALVAEGVRLQKMLSQGQATDRPELLSLFQLGKNQLELGTETEQLAMEKLSEAKVFSRILKKAAQAMASAGEKLKEHSKEINETGKADGNTGNEGYRLQNEALARLNKLLEALKMEAGAALKPAPSQKGGGDSGDGGNPPEGDGIPSLVELKLLRSMQADVNERTAAFGRDHTDLMKLTEEERSQLQALRREQQEIGDLLEELMNADEPSGDMP